MWMRIKTWVKKYWEWLLVLPVLLYGLELIFRRRGKSVKAPVGAMTAEEGEFAHEEIDATAEDKIDQIDQEVEKEKKGFLSHFGLMVVVAHMLASCISGPVTSNRDESTADMPKPWVTLRGACVSVGESIKCEPDGFKQSAIESIELWGAARKFKVEADRAASHGDVDAAVHRGELFKSQEETRVARNQRNWAAGIGLASIVLNVLLFAL